MQETTPELSINLTDVISFIQNVNSMLKNDITAGAAQLKEQLSKFTSNFKKALKTRYDAFIDKMEYCLNYPDAVVNSVLSKLFNTDVNIRFRLIEFLREKANVKIDLSGLKVDVDGSGSTKTKVARRNSPSKSDESNIGMAIIQGLVAAIELDWLNDVLEFWGSSLKKLAQISFEATKQFSLIIITGYNTVVDYIKSLFSFGIFVSGASSFLKDAEKMTNGGLPFVDARGIGRGFAGFIAFFNYFLDIDSAGSGAFSATEDIALATISLIANIVSIFLPLGVDELVSGLGEIVPKMILLIKHGLIMPM